MLQSVIHNSKANGGQTEYFFGSIKRNVDIRNLLQSGIQILTWKYLFTGRIFFQIRVTFLKVWNMIT